MIYLFFRASLISSAIFSSFQCRGLETILLVFYFQKHGGVCMGCFFKHCTLIFCYCYGHTSYFCILILMFILLNYILTSIVCLHILFSLYTISPLETMRCHFSIPITSLLFFSSFPAPSSNFITMLSQSGCEGYPCLFLTSGGSIQYFNYLV